MNNKIKGDAYEIFIRDYIDKFDNVSNVWLWKDIPEQNLFDSGLIIDYNRNRKYRLHSKSNNVNITKDVGIDLVQLNTNGEYIFIQCKNYTNSLCVDHLSGFYMRMCYHINVHGIVYHSTNKLSKNITNYKSDKRIEYIYLPIDSTKVCNDVNQPKTIICKYKPYSYQKYIIKKLKNYFNKNDKGILAMPCGTGKTIIGCYVGKNYDQIIIISPLKQFAQQNMQKFKEYDPKRKGLLIDSDGTRSVKQIKKFIKSNKKFVLSATYKSCDIISQLLKHLTKPLIIIDEFHNLNYNNIYGMNKVYIYK